MHLDNPTQEIWGAKIYLLFLFYAIYSLLLIQYKNTKTSAEWLSIKHLEIGIIEIYTHIYSGRNALNLVVQNIPVKKWIYVWIHDY